VKLLKMSPPEPPDPPPEDRDPSIAQPLRRVVTDFELNFIQRAPSGNCDPEAWREMQVRKGRAAKLRAFDRDARIRRAMLRRSGCARERGCNRDVPADGVHECKFFCSDLSKREFKSAVGWCLRQLDHFENRLARLDSRDGLERRLACLDSR